MLARRKKNALHSALKSAEEKRLTDASTAEPSTSDAEDRPDASTEPSTCAASTAEVSAEEEFPALPPTGPRRAPRAAPRPQAWNAGKVAEKPAAKLARGPMPKPKLERIAIDLYPSQVSAVIGKGGKTIKALEEMSGARISIVDTDPSRPQAVIWGSAESVQKADQLISAKLPYVKHFEVSEYEAGAIIGPGGNTIRGMQQRTGATISVQKFGDTRNVTITAPTKEEVNKALGAIEDALRLRASS